jgi:hypothetical protein
MEFQVAFRWASHERLRGYPAKFDMEFHPFATLPWAPKLEGHDFQEPHKLSRLYSW